MIYDIMFMDIFLAFLYLLPYYILLVLIPGLIYMYFRKKLSKHLIFDNYFTKGKYSKILNTILVSVEEEILFRYFPYAYFKLPGVIIASVIWAILHVPYREYETKLKLICLCYYLSSALFYVYALTVNIIMPLIYHIFHNLVIETFEILYFKKLEKELQKSEFVKSEETKPEKTKEIKKVKFKYQYPFEFVSIKTKSLEYETEEPKKYEFVKAKL